MKRRFRFASSSENHHLLWSGFVWARVPVVFTYTALELFFSSLLALKPHFVQRLFWGRSNLYRSALHTFVLLLTLGTLAIGVMTNLAARAEAAAQPLAESYGTVANIDLLQQGSSITSVLALDQNPLNYVVKKHTVHSGENLDSIAANYAISKDTLKWANSAINYYRENIDVGQILNVPVLEGVLEQVVEGESLDALLARTNGNRFDVIELNRLIPPSYSLAGRAFVFVPNGSKAPPPPPIPQPSVTYYPGGGGYVSSGFTGESLNGIYFDDPLTSPQCAGYVFMRGVLPWHDGVDLAKGGGCPIRAAADGVVTYAGWRGYGSGYTVTIDHGNGVETSYLHGDGNIWVRPGQSVTKGQDIMYMGTTGNSTGVHLHLTLKSYGTAVDPAPYVPYFR